jgi:YD repeat-containing protein
MSTLKRNSVLWLVPVLLLCIALPVVAQTNTSFQYFYDDLGQLTKVIDSTGTVIEYVYDPVGNILQIKRSSIAPGTLAIFNFTPQSGGPAQAVTIQGQGFGATPAANVVQFNGTPTIVTSASSTTLVATVPPAATTGPISVTVSGQTATSSTNFTVLPLPVVVSLSRKSALLNTTFPNVMVTGTNFLGATFAFQPPAITVTSAAVDPTGTSAVLALKVGNQAGMFALVATNSSGSSSAVLTPANRFTVVDPRSTADTDGDGVPDAIEAIFGSDPLDPNSVPVLASSAGQAESPAFTVVNSNGSRTPATFQAEGLAFTVLNSSTQPGTQQRTFQAESPAFTVLNGSSQPATPRTFQAESSAFTVLNSNASGPKTTTFVAEGPAFTVQNSNANRPGTQTTAESPLFSLLNGSASSAHAFAAESSLFSLLNSHIAGLTSKDKFTAASLLFASPPAGMASIRARVQTLTGKKLRPTMANKTKVRKSKTSPSGTAAKKKPSIASSSLASPETETKSNDQQGVTYDNQHR